jgi:hypothetical protein
VSERLGVALARHISRLPGGSQKFVSVENVSEEIAKGIAAEWPRLRDVPKLAVKSSHPDQFPGCALGNDFSGTGLRNLDGICIVVCEGNLLPDRQSLRGFEDPAPSELLKDVEGLTLLADVEPPVVINGPLRHIRGAILTSQPGDRPSADQVARYFDAVASGADPGQALPLLGAFRDRVAAVEFDDRRVVENLRLAARRRTEEVLGSASLNDIRRRAVRVFTRRMHGAVDQAAPLVERFMTLLGSGSDQILDFVPFDEAKEIFEQRVQDLSAQVMQELQDFQNTLRVASASAAESIAWETYVDLARALRRVEDRKAAASELLQFDEIHEHAALQRSTRRKLEGLLRDRQVVAPRSCPEAALVKAVLNLGVVPTQIRLVSPLPPESASSRTAARSALSVALVRFRLGHLLRSIDSSHKTEIDGELLRPPSEGLTPDVFKDAELAGDNGSLPAVVLALVGSEPGESVQVAWAPDLDDIAALKAASHFAASACLALKTKETEASSFCSESDISEVRAPASLGSLAEHLRDLCSNALIQGISGEQLLRWCDAWSAEVDARRQAGLASDLEALELAGAVISDDASVALTAFAPLKSEWIASHLDVLSELVFRALAVASGGTDDDPLEAAADGVARGTSAHYPAFLYRPTRGLPLLPTSQSRWWSVFNGSVGRAQDRYADTALLDVISKLLTLQPEVAGHLRCMAWGPGSADLLLRQAMALAGTRIGKVQVGRIEVFCVGDRPRRDTLSAADDSVSSDPQGSLQVRYLPNLQAARAALQHRGESPGVHLALVTGLTERPDGLLINEAVVPLPARDNEVLFAPRVWVRPDVPRRTLLMPPSASDAGRNWLLLMTAIQDGWPEDADFIRVPEIQADSRGIVESLQLAHEMAMWVATLDRYATRDSLEAALGGSVAILHQEKRLGGDSPLGLVISQKSGGPADRAIGRSLRGAGIVTNPDVALSIGRSLRQVASQGYGILALEAATTGSGINELVGHVVAFSLLSTKATPWPLPAGFRVILVSLDEYGSWFPSGRRADLLAIAMDPSEPGLHVAVIEIKARRSDARVAASQAADQLRQTLVASRFAAYPKPNDPYSRLWLNRIADAAYAVARESGFRLTAPEIGAIESFRRGFGTLEWAGLGLIFGPQVEPIERHLQQAINGDIVPIVIESVKLTEQLLRSATEVRLTELRTVEATGKPLGGGRTKRRPERGVAKPTRAEEQPPVPAAPVEAPPPASEPEGQAPPEPQAEVSPEPPPPAAAIEISRFSPPILGWDVDSGAPIKWDAAGPNAALPNGHIEIWGSSGAGKTQFTMALLSQLSRSSGTHFGIADFKNDYGGEFPGSASARFIDLWEDGAPYNPLALDDHSPRTINRAVIELRDTVDVAARSFTRMGHRQLNKLRQDLIDAYGQGEVEGRWPTLRTLNDLLDEDLAGIIGDLTRHDIFREGPPLGDIVQENVIFGLSNIPGNGLTTILAAGFILSSLLLKLQSLPPVANTIRYCVVVDEAHRVADFRAIDTMVREGRSKGLAVILATQQPADLPEVVAANAQTKICFRLPDSTVAAAAARKLDRDDSRLGEQIRTLGVGEGFISLGGSRPQLVRMAQFWRDRGAIGIAE